MPRAHEFVDETKPSGRYILVATAVEPEALYTVRSTLRSWCHHGSSRIHFAKERDSYRKVLLTRMVSLPVAVRLYIVEGRLREAEARGRAMEYLIHGLLTRGSARLVLERDDSMARGDRQQLARAFRDIDVHPAYVHLRAREEPALWISDAVAWCHQRGGGWPALCAPIVQEVIRIGAS